jgi:hypothetical protein
MAQRQTAHTGGNGLFIIMALIYVSLLILFAWQTYEFVDWLFPSDQVLMKILTLVCFDVMALLWACLDLFYRFAIREARSLVRWGWGISFVLSLLASIFYLIIKSMFRFHLEIDQTQVNIGYGVVIAAVTLQVVLVTFFLYLEWNARHPYQDEYEAQPHTPSRRPANRTAPSRIRVAQTVEAPRRVKQLPSPAPTDEEEDEIDEEDLEDETEEQDDDAGGYGDEESETEEVEAVENVPLSERLTAARNALLPPKSGKKKLPVRK